jgi:YVTN family beta-propeller protein
MTRRGVTIIAALACAAPATAAPVSLPTGRLADPAGRVTQLMNAPSGVAVTPDGSEILAIGGAPLEGGIPSTDPFGPVSNHVGIYVVDAATGAIRQIVDEPDAYGAIVLSHDGQHAYVGGGGDGVVHVLDAAAGGLFTKGTDLTAKGFVSGLALDADGKGLWVGEPESGTVQRIDLAGGAVSRTVAAPGANAVAVSGGKVYATDWRGNAVTAIDAATGDTSQIPVGQHPTGVAALSDGRIVVADANDASLATIDPATGGVSFTDLAQLVRSSDAPNAVAAGPDGRLYVSLGGDDAVAVLAPSDTPGAPHPPHVGVPLPDGEVGAPPSADTGGEAATGHLPDGWRVLGLVPTGWNPTAVALSPDGRDLSVATSYGFGRSPADPAPETADRDAGALIVDGAYGTAGTLETTALPADQAGLDALTARARAAMAPNPAPPAVSENPVLAGPNGPIKHVIYITRENKTYDSELGDLHPGPGNALVLFGQSNTPNLHELEKAFVEADNFTYEGFASVVGHMWEDAGAVSDVMQQAEATQTGLHDTHGNDSWHDPSNYPATGLLTEQAYEAGLTVRTYNEELAQQSHLLPDLVQAPQSVYPNYDLHKADVSREAGWKSEFDQFVAHHCTGVLADAYGADCSLPSLEYVYLGNDHTTVEDEPGYPTIEAQVADNDLATAKVIDAVSHSPYWASTAVIVVEDDPQGTGDDASQWRGYVAIASPWAKRGVISHTHYDLTSAVSTIDHILGLPQLTDWADTSNTFADVFTTTADMTPFTADESGAQLYPFTPLPGTSPLSDRKHGVLSFSEPDETIPRLSNAATWEQIKHTAPPAGY